MTFSLRVFARQLFHFGLLQMPKVMLPFPLIEAHLQRTYGLFQTKSETTSWENYSANLYALDWFLAVACLERNDHAWENLFAARAYRSDCLLVDALRARAARLYPRDEERQENAVVEFWSQLLVSENDESKSVLERYDGQRPLVPWLIRVFQNWHVSQLRQRSGQQTLPDDDVALTLPSEVATDGRWHEAFRAAARECLGELSDHELLILGLRVRYRMSQREVAHLLGIHEGNVSRQTEKLRDRCLERISRHLIGQGWTEENLAEYVRKEMGNIILDDPRLSADQLAKLLAARGKSLPSSPHSIQS